MSNFLPEFIPEILNPGADRPKLRCLVRGKAVMKSPEEVVRQRVLHWLIVEKKWPVELIRLEESYPIVGDPTRERIRSDIELLDKQNSVQVVVECKSNDVPLSEQVDVQAREYALKSNAKWIWLTNGNANVFSEQRDSKRHDSWHVVSSIPPIGETSNPPNLRLEIPRNSRDMRSVNSYLKRFPSGDDGYTVGYEYLSKTWRGFVVDLHSLLFDQASADGLFPYSYEGLHILEYRGRNFRGFSNQGGGLWYGLYADFLAATQGRVETLSVSIFPWGGVTAGEDEVRLCVGVTNEGRTHHALQMNVSRNCEWSEEYGCWLVFSDGRMSSVPNATVLEAMREAGLGHRVLDTGCEDTKTQQDIFLGELYPVDTGSWYENKEFLATLLHYGIVRTNLREAYSLRRRKQRSRT